MSPKHGDRGGESGEGKESALPRLVTYNVHSCIGMDGRCSPERIADVLAAMNPDIVALQELDVGKSRTGGADQAELVARQLSMKGHFHPAMRVEEEEYGDAILTSASSHLVRTGTLPGRSGFEPRGAIRVRVDLGGIEVDVINTHLGLRHADRQLQVETLLGPEWIGETARERPLILAGDFNAGPRSRTFRAIERNLHPVSHWGKRIGPSFPSRFPALRLDHVFASEELRITAAGTLRSSLTTIASDHLPVFVDFGPTTRRSGA